MRLAGVIARTANGSPGDTGCCLGFSAGHTSRHVDQPPDNANVLDDGQAEQAMARYPEVIIVVDEIVGSNDVPKWGRTNVDLGKVLLRSEASAEIWLHELGHLAGIDSSVNTNDGHRDSDDPECTTLNNPDERAVMCTNDGFNSFGKRLSSAEFEKLQRRSWDNLGSEAASRPTTTNRSCP